MHVSESKNASEQGFLGYSILEAVSFLYAYISVKENSSSAGFSDRLF